MSGGDLPSSNSPGSLRGLVLEDEVEELPPTSTPAQLRLSILQERARLLFEGRPRSSRSASADARAETVDSATLHLVSTGARELADPTHAHGEVDNTSDGARRNDPTVRPTSPRDGGDDDGIDVDDTARRVVQESVRNLHSTRAAIEAEVSAAPSGDNAASLHAAHAEISELRAAQEELRAFTNTMIELMAAAQMTSSTTHQFPTVVTDTVQRVDPLPVYESSPPASSDQELEVGHLSTGGADLPEEAPDVEAQPPLKAMSIFDVTTRLLEAANGNDGDGHAAAAKATAITFASLKSREVAAANEASKRIKAADPTFPVIPLASENLAKYKPRFTKGIRLSTTSNDESYVWMLLAVRAALDAICDLLGADKWILRWILNQYEPLSRPLTKLRDDTYFSAIMESKNCVDSGRIQEAFENCLDAIVLALRKYPSITVQLTTTYANKSAVEQLHSVMNHVAAIVLRGWQARDEITRYVPEYMAITPPPSPSRFDDWLAATVELITILDNIGLDGKKAIEDCARFFRRNLQVLYSEHDLVVTTLCSGDADPKDPLLLRRNPNILQTLIKGSAIERECTVDTVFKSPGNPAGGRPAPTHRALVSRVHDASMAEWKNLPDEERRTLARANEAKGKRLSFNVDDSGNRIHEVFCGAKKDGCCGWTTAATSGQTAAQHRAHCPKAQALRAKNPRSHGGGAGKKDGGKKDHAADSDNIICNRCGEKGHRARNCKKSQASIIAATMATTLATFQGLQTAGAATTAASTPAPATTPAQASSTPANRHALFTQASGQTASSTLQSLLGSGAGGSQFANRTCLTLNRLPSAAASGMPTTLGGASTTGCFSGYDAEEDPGPDGDYVPSIDPFRMFTWPPSISHTAPDKVTFEDFSAEFGTDMSRVKTPQHYALSTDSMRIMGEAYDAGFNPADAYDVALQQDILEKTAPIDYVSYVASTESGDAELEKARVALAYPKFRRRDDIVNFLKMHGVVWDDASNLHAVNNAAFVSEMYEADVRIGTVGQQVILDQAGTLSVQALGIDGRSMVRLPPLETSINPTGNVSVIGGRRAKKEYDTIDGCTDPTRDMIAEGAKPYVSIEGEHLLVAEFEHIMYIFVTPRAEDSAMTQHVNSFSTMIVETDSIYGPPSYEETVLKAFGTSPPSSLPATMTPSFPPADLYPVEVDGIGFTTTAANTIDTSPGIECEECQRVDDVHRALDDLHLSLVTTRRGTTSSAAAASTVRQRRSSRTLDDPSPAPNTADEESESDSDGLTLLDIPESESDSDAPDPVGTAPAASERQGGARADLDDDDPVPISVDPGEGPDAEPDEEDYDDPLDSKPPRNLRVSRISMIEWHSILGHCSARTVRATLAARGFRAFDDHGGSSPFHCHSCAIANAQKTHRGGRLGMQRDKETDKPGELVCVDVLHLGEYESLTGIVKLLLWVDKKSGMCGVAPYTLNPHDSARYQLGGVILRVILEVRRLSGIATTISVHSDLAKDEVNLFTEEQLAAMGAIQFQGAAYHSNSNPLAEVMIRILRTKARAMAIQGGLPPQFTVILLKQAAELFNDSVGDDGKSPRQRMTGAAKPYACPFDTTPGRLGTAYRTNNKGSKQDARGHVVIYLGRGSLVRQVGFMVYDPVGMRVFVTPSVRFATGPFETQRFPYMEGLWTAIAKLAKRELMSTTENVQPYDVVLPNGSYVWEYIEPGRKVMARSTSGRGYDVGTVVTARYTVTGPGRDLYFGVKWEGECEREREKWYDFTELSKILVDDSEVESLINFATASPKVAHEIMSDASRFGSILHTATCIATHRAPKGADAKKRVGRINETMWTDIAFALRDAESDEERDKWRAALQKEMMKLFEEKDVFEWTDLQPGDMGPMKLNLPCKKKDQGDLHGTDGEVVYKVRIVGGMSKQEMEGRYGVPIGGWESFAATIAQGDLLHFLAIVAELGLHLWGLDVEAAYLCADAPRANLVYRPPANYRAPDPAKPYLRCKKALYGFLESGAAWARKLVGILTTTLGFVPCDRNSTWYIRRSEEGIIMCGTVVDDIAVGTSTVKLWLTFLAEIKQHLPVDAGPCRLFIGVSIDYNQAEGIMRLSQAHLIDVACTRFGINKDCKKFTTPMEYNAKVSTNDSPQVPDADDVLRMQSILGTLQYLTLTRHDIKYAVNLLARVASNPSKKHLEMAQRVLMYVVRTRDMPLVYSRGPWYTPEGLKVEPGQIVIYVDASFGDSGPELKTKSRTGYTCMRAGATFRSKSSLQPTTAGSSCQAEVIALYAASLEAQAALQDLIRLGMPHDGPILMMEDNSAAISVMSAAGTCSNAGSRHFLVKYFYTRELIEDGSIKLVKCGTLQQLADGFTKPLLRLSHERHRHFIQGLHALPLEELTALGFESYEPTSTSS